MRRAVIFDIDGTLLHSAGEDDRLYRNAVAKVLGNVRVRPGLHDYRRVTDTGILLHILEDNGLAVTPGVVDDVQAEFFSAIRHHIDTKGPFAVVPGAREFVDRLLADECTGVAIATGGWRESARMKLDASGFDIPNVPVATSDDASERTAIMQIALDSLSGSHDAVIYYGDGAWDRDAAAALGWRFRAVGVPLNGITSFDGEV